MATSVGEIGLDLVINQKQYDKQLKGITSIAKKAGAALAAAFAVKKIADFGNDCIKLGSDLAEVQNVVDVTFSQMKTQVDEFAKSAAASFGLSETMAKKFTGTFGAMAKAFGFSESAAYDIGTTLTGLAGDVASFYNISQDEAYTKLKSVFTGETETLKDLGVVMTQNALDAYAMANGYGKTTQAMSEAEKVALRYAFVQNQLSAATGDFARTSDSWANQVRILSLQFDSLKATIGQGLINLFTPIIKVINTVIGKLATLANAFKSFTELLTGKKSGTSQVTAAGTAAEESLNSAAGAADSLSSATSGAGAAAKKAAKEMKALMGFDQINKLDDNSGGDSGNSGGSGGASSGGAVDFGTLAEGETVIDKTDKSLNKLIKRVKELAGIFKKGFQIGFGDSEKNIQKLKDSISSIGKKLKEIFTSKEVTDAANKWVESVVFSLGKITGSVAGVGVAIATNLVSGVTKSLEKKKGYIQAKISSIFAISGESWKLTGDFAAAFGEIISSVLTSDAAVNITSDICSILTTGVLGGAELFLQAGLDLSSVLLQPIIENKDKIKEAIVNTLKPVSEVIGTVKTGVEDAFLIIKKAYDKHVAPTFQALKEGVSDSFGKFLDAYNKHVAPVLSKLAKKFNEVYKGHIKPVLEKIGGLIGTVGDAIKKIYEQTLKPVVDWLIQTIIPVLAPIFETIGGTVLEAFGAISDAVGGLIDVFGGVISFITGIFIGDWEQAGEGLRQIIQTVVEDIKRMWNGLKTFLSSIWESIKKIFKPVAGWFKKQFDKAAQNVKNAFATIGGWFLQRYEDITGAFKDIHNWFKDKFRSAYTGIKNVFSSIGSWFKARYTSVTNAFKNVGAWFKEKFKSAYTSVTNAFSNIGAWFKARYQNITNVFKSIPIWFKSKFSSAWEGIKGVFSGVGDFFGGIWETIKSKFTTIGTSIGDAVGGAFKSVINSVLSMIENTINKGIGFINGAIDGINKINPFKDIKHLGKVDLPRLAQGGFVKANTPQLAMIGDNRHQGEVVAPEDKLKEMALEAVKMAGGGNSMTSEVVQLLKELITLVKELDLDVLLDGKSIKENTVNRINQHTKATGVCEII